MKKPLILLVGAGGHCRSCIDVVEQDGRYQIAGVVDRPGADSPADVLGYPILGNDDDLGRLHAEIGFALVTVGQMRCADVRVGIYKRLKALGYLLPVIRSPVSYLARSAEVGEGTVVMHGVTVNAAARVGCNCILNSHCLIEHDAMVEDHCHISTGALVNGQAHVGAGSFIGSGAVVVQSEKVPNGSFVKARSLFYSGKKV